MPLSHFSLAANIVLKGCDERAFVRRFTGIVLVALGGGVDVHGRAVHPMPHQLPASMSPVMPLSSKARGRVWFCPLLLRLPPLGLLTVVLYDWGSPLRLRSLKVTTQFNKEQLAKFHKIQ